MCLSSGMCWNSLFSWCLPPHVVGCVGPFAMMLWLCIWYAAATNQPTNNTGKKHPPGKQIIQTHTRQHIFCTLSASQSTRTRKLQVERNNQKEETRPLLWKKTEFIILTAIYAYIVYISYLTTCSMWKTKLWQE